MNVAELHEGDQPPPNILLYGEVGSGKTVLALTLGERAQVLDCDLGLRSGFSVQDEFTKDRRAVDVKQFKETSLPRRAIAFEKLKSCVFEISTQCNQKRYPFDVVIMDSLTVFAQSALNYILSNANRLGQNPEIQHWGMAFNEIHMVLGVLTALPIPFILIGHESIKTFGKGKDAEDRLILSVKGKNMPPDVMRLFDEVWYMRSARGAGGKRAYTIQTYNNGALVARSRACIPDMTDTCIGMWKLLELMGYKPKEKPVNAQLTTTPTTQTAVTT